MTAHNIVLAFTASEEDRYRLAWRTAYFHRVAPKHFPRSEDAIFASTRKPRRQTTAQQFAMARLITKVMTSKEKH